MRHVISALVINEPGVLANVAGMFAARGFNIDSLVVGRTENPDLSRMTIVVTADENTLEQVRKQLAKLVPVVKVPPAMSRLFNVRFTMAASPVDLNPVVMTSLPATVWTIFGAMPVPFTVIVLP